MQQEGVGTVEADVDQLEAGGPAQPRHPRLQPEGGGGDGAEGLVAAGRGEVLPPEVVAEDATRVRRREVGVVPDRGDVIEHELVTEPGQEGEAGHREQHTEGGEVSQHCLAFNHGSLTSSGTPLLSLIG